MLKLVRRRLRRDMREDYVRARRWQTHNKNGWTTKLFRIGFRGASLAMHASCLPQWYILHVLFSSYLYLDQQHPSLSNNSSTAQQLKIRI